MTERKYLQVNLDTDTLPTSSVMHDVSGNTLAKLDLNLSSNLIGNTAAGKLPSRVELKVTKMSIPVANVPFAVTDIEDLQSTAPMYRDFGITLRAAMILIPTYIRDNGNFYDSRAYATASNPFSNRSGLHPKRLTLPYPVSGSDRSRWIEEANRLGVIPIHDLQDILLAISECQQAIMDEAEARSAPLVRYHIKNGKLTFSTKPQITERGNPAIPQSPYYYDYHEFVWNGQHWISHAMTFDGSVDDPDVNLSPLPYVIGGNDQLRKLLPTLPWRKYSINDVPAYSLLPIQKNEWIDINHNNPEVYILDMRSAQVDYCKYEPEYFCLAHEINTTPGEEYPTWEEDVGSRTVQFNKQQVDLSFPEVNPISFSGVTSFVLMVNGLDASQQIFPVNITRNSDAATQIPILEVYYPVWNTIADRSDKVLISKDEFTNTPVFTTNNYSSICDRNITFTLYNVLSGGKLYPLTLFPHTRFCLQLTLCLYY